MKRTGLRRATPLKRSGELKRTGRLPFRSKRRAREEREYTLRRREFLASHDFCEVCANEMLVAFLKGKVLPVYRATEVHHKRGRVGKLLLDIRYWLAVCSTHHRLITENPAWAIEHGWSDSRLATT